MKSYDVIIIGGGPSGLVTGMTTKKLYPNKSVLIITQEQKGLVPCGIPYIFHDLESVEQDEMGLNPFLDVSGEINYAKVLGVDLKKKRVFVFSDEKIKEINTHIENIKKILFYNADLSTIGYTPNLIIKAGISTNLTDLKTAIQTYEKTTLLSNQIGKGKKQAWAVVIVSHISEKKNIEKGNQKKNTETQVEKKRSPQKSKPVSEWYQLSGRNQIRIVPGQKYDGCAGR